MTPYIANKHEKSTTIHSEQIPASYFPKKFNHFLITSKWRRPERSTGTKGIEYNTFCGSPWPYCPIDWNLLPADIKRFPSANQQKEQRHLQAKFSWVWQNLIDYVLMGLPDLAEPVNLASIKGIFLTKEWDVAVSASSHARERFSKVSPNSWPHWESIFIPIKQI